MFLPKVAQALDVMAGEVMDFAQRMRNSREPGDHRLPANRV